LFEKEELTLLSNLGFTQTQAQLYLTLLKMKKTDAGTLSRHTRLARPVVYRGLAELQKKGLVEKEITKPYTFRATPIQYGLQVLIMQKVEECKEIQEKTETFLRKIQSEEEDTPVDQEYSIVMIDGKERLIQKIREWLDSAQRSTDIISTFQRWLQIFHYCCENYENALKRGVKYRVIIEKPISGDGLPENFLSLMTNPDFELRSSPDFIKTNAAIFDGKEVAINYYPFKLLAESPIIWTNHPSFLTTFQKNFEDIWESALKLDINDVKIFGDELTFATKPHPLKLILCKERR
jgi:sugar-specific transcriptional regulator TrmB